jgi:hypothetical protein
MTAERLVAQTTNAVAATTDAAKATLDTAMPPVKEAAPNAMAATNTAPEKPQAVADQATTTLAGLSQDQMVRGL